jgi:hypothetical protein
MRDPDGYLIEVGQYPEIALDWFNNRSSSERSAAASGNAGLPGWRIVLLGNHRLLCGDATSAEAGARLVRGAISDALFGRKAFHGRSPFAGLAGATLPIILYVGTGLSSAVAHPDRVPDNPGNGRTAVGVGPLSIVRHRISGQRRPTSQAFTLAAQIKAISSISDRAAKSGPRRAFTVTCLTNLSCLHPGYGSFQQPLLA